jgi:hypothetical protein
MWSAFAARTISAPDADASSLKPLVCTDASRLSYGGICDTAGGAITFRILFLCQGQIVGCTGPYTLQAGQVPDWGQSFIGNPDDTFPVPANGDSAIAKVDAVSGTWTFAACSS